jgi:hypothetical protein
MSEKNGPHMTVMLASRRLAGGSTSAISVASCCRRIVCSPLCDRIRFSRE